MYQWPDPKGEPVLEGTGQGDLTLLELPEQLAARGIGLLEICHFHFPRLDDDYISQLRQALADSGVELFSVLIDAGDIAHPDEAQRAKEVVLGPRVDGDCRPLWRAARTGDRRGGK